VPALVSKDVPHVVSSMARDDAEPVSGPRFCADPLAPPHHEVGGGGSPRLQSGIKAKVQTEPPGGTLLSASRAWFQYTPPIPDSTVTYCRPL
jgi:hypothetical protein